MDVIKHTDAILEFVIRAPVPTLWLHRLLLQRPLVLLVSLMVSYARHSLAEFIRVLKALTLATFPFFFGHWLFVVLWTLAYMLAFSGYWFLGRQSVAQGKSTCTK